jgi:hypothetical protein
MMVSGDPICPNCKRYLSNAATDQYGRHICYQPQHIQHIMETKMTQHNPADVEALKLAAIAARNTIAQAGDYHGIISQLDTALAKLEPKPEKVYTLPAWAHRGQQHFDYCAAFALGPLAWDRLQELTAIEPPVNKWNVPEWAELVPENTGWVEIDPTLTPIAAITYKALRKKIMGMNEESK